MTGLAGATPTRTGSSDRTGVAAVEEIRAARIGLQAVAGSLATTQQFTGAVNQNSYTPPSLVPNGALDIFFNTATANAVGSLPSKRSAQRA